MTKSVKTRETAARAENIVMRAYDMFPQKHQPDKHLESFGLSCPFPMYSFERAATMFWTAVSERLIEGGMSDEGVEEILRSKRARWMLDAADKDFEDLAAQLIPDDVLASWKEQVEVSWKR